MSRRLPLHRRASGSRTSRVGESRRSHSAKQTAKRPPSSKNSAKLPLVVFAVFGVILVALVFMLSSGDGERPAKRQNTEDRKIDIDASAKDHPTLPGAPIRSLPEGRLGEWAKSVVYLEVGTITQWASLEFRCKKMGTGFVISKDGKILTNEHVISDGETIIATFYDGKRRVATLSKADPDLDAALLTVDLPPNIPSLRLSTSREIRIGRRILVMGFPLGNTLGTEMTLTDGLLSSIRHEIETPIWYQISAAVNSGNSGGPLLDEKSGEVLGVVTAKVFWAEAISLARPITLIMNNFLQGDYGSQR